MRGSWTAARACRLRRRSKPRVEQALDPERRATSQDAERGIDRQQMSMADVEVGCERERTVDEHQHEEWRAGVETTLFPPSDRESNHGEQADQHRRDRRLDDKGVREVPPPAGRPEAAVEKGGALRGELQRQADAVDVRLRQQMEPLRGRETPADEPRRGRDLPEE